MAKYPKCGDLYKDCELVKLLDARVLQVVADSNKLQLEAAQRIQELEAEQWYLSPQCDTPTSPHKGKGQTWVQYAHVEFKRAEELKAENKQLKEELKQLCVCLLVMSHANTDDGVWALPGQARTLKEGIERALVGREG